MKICYTADIKAFGRTYWPAVSDWPRTYLHPGCFCLAYHYIWKMLLLASSSEVLHGHNLSLPIQHTLLQIKL